MWILPSVTEISLREERTGRIEKKYPDSLRGFFVLAHCVSDHVPLFLAFRKGIHDYIVNIAKNTENIFKN